MDIEIGSCLYRNTDGTVEIEGVPQIEFVLKGPDGPLLVSFVIFDEAGRLVVKLVDSSMMFNESGAYSLNRQKTSVLLTESKSGKVVFHAELKDADRVALRKGEFGTPKGHTIEITAVDWRIGSVRSPSGEQDLKGGSVTIG